MPTVNTFIRSRTGAFRPRLPLPVARMAGPHGTVWPGAVDGREGLFSGRRRRGGVLRSNEDGIRLSRASGGTYNGSTTKGEGVRVYPGHREERTRDEVLVLIDDYIRWYNHERIKQSLGWMSPVQYRQSQGTAA